MSFRPVPALLVSAAGLAACGGEELPPGTLPAMCASRTALVQQDILCDANRCRVPAGKYAGPILFEAANRYLLEGKVFIGDASPECAGQLTVEAGGIVDASSETGAYLAILPNSTITANGTPTEPILFTSDSASPMAG